MPVGKVGQFLQSMKFKTHKTIVQFDCAHFTNKGMEAQSD